MLCRPIYQAKRMMKRVNINGFHIHPFKSKRDFLNHLEDSEWDSMLVAMNAEKLMKEDDTLKELINKNIGYPDGDGAVLALKKKGVDSAKIAGSEFWLDIVEEFYKGRTFYLVGAKQNVISNTVSKLKKDFKGIEICGYRDGYFNDEEFEGLVADIEEKEPDIVFVAMGSPRQEYVMQELKVKHSAIYMGLGGSFDVYAGDSKRAPKVWIDLKLEWAYRLYKEPKRIFRQMTLVKFVFKLVTNKL